MQGNFNFIQNFQVNWHKLRIPVFLWSDLASPLFFLQGQCLEIVDPPPCYFMILTHLGPLFICKGNLAYRFRFCEDIRMCGDTSES